MRLPLASRSDVVDAVVVARLCQRPARSPGTARANRRLYGQLVDYSRNHGRDNRLWSPALGQKHDMYVYLPPGYDPCQRYPLVLWLHGFAQDEISFLPRSSRPWTGPLPAANCRR